MLKIRLSRRGAKKRPFYSIVLADIRSPRDGKFLEKLGTYNPMVPKDDPQRITLDDVRIKHWLDQGAQPTDRVARFLGKANIIPMPKYKDSPLQSKPKQKAQERAEEKAKKISDAAEAEAAAKAKAIEDKKAEAAAALEAKKAEAEAASEAKKAEAIAAAEPVADSASETKEDA